MNWIRNIAILLLLVGSTQATEHHLDLGGNWEVSLTAPDANPIWKDIQLPGTLDDAGIGEPLTLQPALNITTLARLQRRFTHIGPAWYRRSVEIPASWAGQQIRLELERALWETRVFVDGREISRADSLATPHVHDLSAALRPGRHEILIRIDNSEIYREVSFHANSYPRPEDAPLAHAYTNHTQTMWNGALGSLRLVVGTPTEIARLQIYPNLQPTPSLSVRIQHTNSLAEQSYRVRLRRLGESSILAETTLPLSQDGLLHWTLPTSTEIVPWSEFTPQRYELEVVDAHASSISRKAVFGFRHLAAVDQELRLNGQRIFLRGNLECSIFPLTGYPPTDVDSWIRLMKTAKDWGLNHLRFHSWCPPEAAFEAADEIGIYLQVELPHWGLHVGSDPATSAFLKAEGDRILERYGNHPSFCILSLGNELQGDMNWLNDEVRRLRSIDPRHLYTATTFTFEKGHGRSPEPADDVFITQYTEDGWIRGQGIFNEKPPAFDTDYRAAARRVETPLISHEIGQYSVYPDLSEISKYKGNLVPLNFISVRNDLEQKGLLHLAPDFTDASGRFAALLYKEEIERALRTPQFDGFQLLQLQDFPGQGTALVGLLNAFWDPKGFISADEFRQFCGPVVPLALFPKAVYESGEPFSAAVKVANFLRPLPNARVAWRILDTGSAEIATGALKPADLPAGETVSIGKIETALPSTNTASQLRLEIEIAGTDFRNSWNIWVYPKSNARLTIPSNVTVTSTLAAAKSALANGERVIFTPPPASVRGIPGKFVPVFWSPVHFPDQPGTMGILCDPEHPALTAFPTARHSDWQWWDLALRSKSVIIDALPVEPIVRVIDNFNRNHALSNVFETQVGKGRLIFSAIDLHSDLDTRPEARQLLASLMAYASSDAFKPQGQLAANQLESLLISGGQPPK